MAPPTNPYMRPAAAAAAGLQNGVSQSTMGPQSQRRLTLKERTHQMQASSRRKKQKGEGGQQTLFGNRAFDPLEDCAVCKAKRFGREVHRAHDERCINNRRTRGFSKAAVALQQEEARLKKHFATPLTKEEKCRGVYATPEAAAAFFAPQEVMKIAGKITTSKSTTITNTVTTTTQFTATCAEGNDIDCPMISREPCPVTQLIPDPSFLAKHKNSKAPIAMLAFARTVVKRIIRNKRADTLGHFNGLTMTVPATNSMHPQYHSIVGQKLLNVDWIMMYGLEINCPRCKASNLTNDRTNFSKNKLLFPIFVIDGPPLWCMVMSMTCPCCRYRVDANTGEVLCSLPAYARNAYPVETKYAFDNKNSHIGRSATTVFDLLMTTYGNGDLCSRLLYNAINRSYIERVENCYSLQKEGALPYVEKDGEYITKYPPTGDSIRDAYNAACSSLNTPWGISDHDRHTREIQSVSCKLIFAQDHTHEVTKNYFKKKSIGANALWDVATETGEIAAAVLVPTVGQSDLSIQSQSHIEPHSRERSSAHRYRDIYI